MEEGIQALYRLLPSITEIETHLESQSFPFIKSARTLIQGQLHQWRQQIQLEPSAFDFSSKQEVLDALTQHLQHSLLPPTTRVLNATGVVIHTNLGRAPLSSQSLEHLQALLSGYSNLEYDLREGKRGARGARVISLLTQLAQSEAALVVNNNAAAVYLSLAALAQGKEVIVSRGELVEIGGSFRIPEIMEAAGVQLVEVGTTNRTRISDYEQAISEKTVALMKVHPSNYHISGFVESTRTKDLATLAKRHHLWCFDDIGSGHFYRFTHPKLQSLPTLTQQIQEGADLTLFSGDKLLGSAQAGLIVGQEDLIQRLKQHPLYRILRPDKVTLALLETHLQSYLEIETVLQEIPALQLLEQTVELIHEKANTLFQGVQDTLEAPWHLELKDVHSLVGGGALPEMALESVALVLRHSQQSAQWIQDQLRQLPLPLIGRIENDELLLDCRTLFIQDLEDTIQKLKSLFTNNSESL